MEKENFLANDNLAHLSNSELIILVHNSFLLNKAKALFFLGKRCTNNQRLMSLVEEEIFALKNINEKVIGTVSISFFGIAGLIESNHPQSKIIINRFLELTKQYPHIESDLKYFLEGFDYEI